MRRDLRFRADSCRGNYDLRVRAPEECRKALGIATLSCGIHLRVIAIAAGNHIDIRERGEPVRHHLVENRHEPRMRSSASMNESINEAPSAIAFCLWI